MSASMRFARYQLDSDQRDLLGKEITERVTATELDSDSDEAILASIGAHAFRHYLPGEIVRALRSFCESGCHALMLSNLPVQRIPPTPVSGFVHETPMALTNALHFGLIQLLGVVPFAVEYENNGRLIRNVVPNPAAAGISSSWGADKEFSWHTDNPHLTFGEAGTYPCRHIPRYLTFFALRNEEQVPMCIVSADDAVAQLDPASRQQLLSPEFTVGAPESTDSDDAGQRQEFSDAAILEISRLNHYWARYDPGTTTGQTVGANAALQAWKAALQAVDAVECVLRPGDFIVIDNYRVLHRRPAFTPQQPATARWLRRCYAS